MDPCGLGRILHFLVSWSEKSGTKFCLGTWGTLRNNWHSFLHVSCDSCLQPTVSKHCTYRTRVGILREGNTAVYIIISCHWNILYRVSRRRKRIQRRLWNITTINLYRRRTWDRYSRSTRLTNPSSMYISRWDCHLCHHQESRERELHRTIRLSILFHITAVISWHCRVCCLSMLKPIFFSFTSY